MKFYLVCGSTSIEDSDGQWATRDEAEQVEKERDEFERKCRDLCIAHGNALMELHNVKKDAAELARLVLNSKCPTDMMCRKALDIIDRYEGGK